MSEIVAIVEGETEQTFVRGQLAAHLGSRGITIWAVLSGKAHRHGGVRKWEGARADILRSLREGRYCTTMFDYYGMPPHWPGRETAQELPWHERATHVEAEVRKEIATAVGGDFNPAQFIPYVQLHEFEALLFSNTETLADVLSANSHLRADCLRQELDRIVAGAGDPEAIDDGYETCPSRRITTLVSSFRKRFHSPIVTQRIGLEALAARCAHFCQWLQKLEALPAAGTGRAPDA